MSVHEKEEIKFKKYSNLISSFKNFFFRYKRNVIIHYPPLRPLLVLLLLPLLPEDDE